MPRFMRRRERPPKPAAETPIADADLIEQEILEAERRFKEEEHRIGRKWARWMGRLFGLGLVAALLMFVTAAAAPDSLIVASLISTVVNAISSYATRKGSIVAPNKFPATYRSHTGPVNGANFSLGIAGLSGVLVIFAIRYRFF